MEMIIAALSCSVLSPWSPAKKKGKKPYMVSARNDYQIITSLKKNEDLLENVFVHLCIRKRQELSLSGLGSNSNN